MKTSFKKTEAQLKKRLFRSTLCMCFVYISDFERSIIYSKPFLALLGDRFFYSYLSFRHRRSDKPSSSYLTGKPRQA